MTTNWRSWCWHLRVAIFLTISWVSVVTPNVVISAPDSIEQETNAQSPDNTISSIYLECKRTANTTGSDQISLEIDYVPIWGPHPISATQVVNFNNVIPLHYNARIEFFVHGADGSKVSLGSSSALAIGRKPLKFKRYGAEYALTYQIGATY